VNRAVPLADLVQVARTAPVLFLPAREPHPAGMVVGLVSAGLGIWLQSSSLAQRDMLGWLALGGVMLGMLLHWGLWRSDRGWRVDFDARAVAPQGVPGEAVVVAGEGWSLACAPGQRRASLALELRHAERGKVASVFDTAGRAGPRQAKWLNELADLMAARLRIERSGPRL
jgi:hypothetical protein